MSVKGATGVNLCHSANTSTAIILTQFTWKAFGPASNSNTSYGEGKFLQAKPQSVGMPLLTRCHCQCVYRLCQIFATLCDACFYVGFSVENEVYAGNFCPKMNRWALLSMQTCCFSEKIECCRKWLSLKFCLLFKMFSTIVHPCVIHKINDQLVILLFSPRPALSTISRPLSNSMCSMCYCSLALTHQCPYICKWLWPSYAI